MKWRLLVWCSLSIAGANAAPALGKTVVSRVHAFSLAEGVAIPRSVIQGRDGAFYGTASYPNESALFRFSPTDGLSFVPMAPPGGVGSPGSPEGGLIQARDGRFYGTTWDGGAFGFGTVFRWTLPNTVTVLHSFSGGADGANPSTALTEAPDGSFYGTTTGGGTCGPSGGTIFRITAAGILTTQHAFGCGTDGAAPYGALSPASDGSFYGATYTGGIEGLGTIYRFSATGAVTIVHDFRSTDPMSYPLNVIWGADGRLYGITFRGSSLFSSAIFSMSDQGDLTLLHEIEDGEIYPPGPLLRTADGTLYAVYQAGSGVGEALKIAPGPRVSRLHLFRSILGLDGFRPSGGLIQTADGAIYGVTGYGGGGAPPGSPGYGLLYRLVTAAAGDYDGNGMSDATVYRPSNGTWYALSPPAQTARVIAWGAPGDTPAPGDYDSDGLTDAAIFRPSTGTWWIRDSRAGTFTSIAWGNPGDRPVAGDYDGDGLTDPAVFRPSNGTWNLRFRDGTSRSVPWGNSADRPVPGDFDGDGITDVAVFRPSSGTWYVIRSASGVATGSQWGNADDVPVPGDYDGDGKTDIAVFRPADGTWYIVRSSSGSAYGFAWGNGADIPVPGDYDGDERTDIAVFRPSTGEWFIVYSQTGRLTVFTWGNASDIPVVSAP